MAGRLALPGQDGQDDVTGGESRLQRLGTGGLDGGQPMLGHGPQDLDELAVAIGMLGELGADLAQAGRQVPVLEGCAIAQGTGLLQQDRQIVPGIVDGLIAPEASGVIGDHLVVEQHDDPLGMGSHQDHAARCRASML